MGRDKEAVEAYVSAAERVLGRGDHAEAERLAERALKIAAKNEAALAIKARAIAAGGKRGDAAPLLEKRSRLETAGEAAGFLLAPYLPGQNPEQAARLAMKTFEHD